MIKPNILEQIKASNKCKAGLQVALDKSAGTINRYLNDNDIMLTTAAALSVIKEFTSLTEEEILDREEIKSA